MDSALISALAALAGSVVGGLTSAASSWLTQRSQARAGRLAHELAEREQLYRDFIVAASNTYGDALVSNEPKLQAIIGLYAMISQMRMHSSADVIGAADRIMHETVATYLAPNRTVAEIHDLARNGAAIDMLRGFAELARNELRASRGP